jgi:peptide/nickel transport system permease protein
MMALVIRRLLWMIPTLLIISLISFSIIQLPPGDYLTSYIAALEETGETVTKEQAAKLRKQYNLDEPFVMQYLRWAGIKWFLSPGDENRGLLQGNMGMSFEHNRPVTQLIGERLLFSATLSVCALIMTWAIAIPIGIYAAVRQYSVGDYFFTFLGFIGLSVPHFLLALVFMYVMYAGFGVSPGGLFSPEFQNATWSLAKVWDLLQHLLVPVIIVGAGGTAGMIRVMRGNLLDELRKQYVLTARAKGVGRVKLLLKYPVRVALNPFISTIGWILPRLVAGSTIVSIVLGLPTTGPILLEALKNQDMYLAGSIVMLLSTLTVIGTLISDLLLLWLDPRIRMEGGQR